MKKALLFFLLLAQNVFATHNLGGHISYKHLSGYSYEITVEMFTDANSPATRCQLTLYSGAGDSAYAMRVNGPVSSICSPATDGVLLLNIAGTSVWYSVYKCSFTYPAPGSYTITMYDPNHSASILNMPNSVNTPFNLEAKLIINSLLVPNNSATLSNYIDVDSSAVYHYHTYNSEASDMDNDSLVFTFYSPIGSNGYTQPPATLGFWINNFMGEVTWDSPNAIGKYLYAIRIDEYRRVGNQYFFVGYTTREVLTFVATTVSTNEINAPQIVTSVFPNPSSSDLTISIKDTKNRKDLTLEVLDLTGRKVKSINNINTTTIVIERKGLLPGFYMYKLMDGDQFLSTGKFEIIE